MKCSYMIKLFCHSIKHLFTIWTGKLLIILSALLPAFFKHSIPSPVLTHASLLQARASWPAPSSAVATVFQVSLLDTELQASEKAPESVSPTSENQSREKTVSALTWVARVMRAAEMRMVR